MTNEKLIFSASKIMKNGKPTIQFVIKNAHIAEGVYDAICEAGYEMFEGRANTRRFFAATAEEIDRARPQILIDYLANHPECIGH